MSTDPSPLKPMGTQSKETVDLAAAKAQGAVQAAQHAVDQGSDRLADKVDDTCNGVTAMVDKVSNASSSAVAKAKDKAQSASRQVWEQAQIASDRVTTYTKDEPIKAMLIAAAAGALLVGVVSLMARSKGQFETD